MDAGLEILYGEIERYRQSLEIIKNLKDVPVDVAANIAKTTLDKQHWGRRE